MPPALRLAALLPAFAVAGVATVGLPSASPGQATQAATRPVSEAKAAVLVVRGLVDRAGTPRFADAVRQVEEIGKPNDAPAAMRAAAAWVAANREALDGVGKSPLPATPWGGATYRPAGGGGGGSGGGGATVPAPVPAPNPVASDASRPATATVPGPAKLYLHVFEWHASGKVIAYGLPAATVARAYLLREPSKALKVDPAARDATVEVAAKNAKVPDPIGTVVVLELTGDPKPRPLAVPASADGSVPMHARDAVVVGRTLRYEPEPNKDTLGYWTDPADWAYWEFTVDRPGTYEVELLQGCGKNSGGSEVDVTVDAQSFPMTVQDTGHFQNFVPRVVGKATLAKGPHRLEVKVRRKQGAAVMDLRQVTLKPVGG